MLDDDWVFRAVSLDPRQQNLEIRLGSADDPGFGLTILIDIADIQPLDVQDRDADDNDPAIREVSELLMVFTRQASPSDVHEPTIRLPLDWNPYIF